MADSRSLGTTTDGCKDHKEEFKETLLEYELSNESRYKEPVKAHLFQQWRIAAACPPTVQGFWKPQSSSGAMVERWVVDL